MKKSSRSLNRLFYILYILYLINGILAESQYSLLQPYSTILTVMRYLDLAAFAVLGVSRSGKMNKTRMILGLVTLGITVITVLFYDGGIGILFIIFILMAGKNRDLSTIFKTTVITIVATYLFVILSSQVGIIPDNVGTRWIGNYAGSFFAGEYVRHAMGFLVSNQVPVTFLMVYILIIGWTKGNISLWLNTAFALINIYLFYNFGSRIVFVVTFVAIIVFYGIKIREKLGKISRHKTGKRSVLTYSFIGAAIISFAVSLLYTSSSSTLQYLDVFFNHRISMASEAIKYYGIHFIGMGKDAATYNGALNTVTVDNGYVSLFIQNGFVVGIIVIVALTYITQKATYYKNRYILWALVIFAALNMINADLISYRAIAWYCILVNPQDQLLLSDEVLMKKRKRLFRITRGSDRSRTSSVVVTAARRVQ